MKKTTPTLAMLTLVNIIAVFGAGCSSPAYNPDNPDEYVEYWCDPAHRNQAIPPEQDWRNIGAHETADAYREECLQQYYLKQGQ